MGERLSKVAKLPGGWRIVGLWMDDGQLLLVVVLEGVVVGVGSAGGVRCSCGKMYEGEGAADGNTGVGCVGCGGI